VVVSLNSKVPAQVLSHPPFGPIEATGLAVEQVDEVGVAGFTDERGPGRLTGRSAWGMAARRRAGSWLSIHERVALWLGLTTRTMKSLGGWAKSWPSCWR